MRTPMIPLAVLGAMLALASPAEAFTCYMLYDRNDNLVYRDTLSPVDMSEQGDAAREAMRRQGEYLIVADADRCPQVRFVFGSAGSKTLSVDTVVGGLPPATLAGAKAASHRTSRGARSGVGR